MKENFKTRLAILSILAAIVYLFIITTNIVSGWKSSVKALKKVETCRNGKQNSKSSWQSYVTT